MIWATVSPWFCFCWLYRASPSLVAKNLISLILVLAIWWCPLASWMPVKPLHLRGMFSRWMSCTKDCNACSWYRSKERALFSRRTPTAQHTVSTSKAEQLDYKVLPHLPCSPDLLPTDYHFFKHLENFFQGKCFHNQAENTFQDFVKF